jgi:endonuclease/exonuclease/phosphatase family metal-dependent hydrolase
MRRIAILLAAIVAGVLVATGVGLAASSSGSQPQTSSNKEDPSVKIMTRNVYHGVNAELADAARAPTQAQFFVAANNVFEGYHERNFPERAALLAAEIKATQPDVVGLQEVVTVRTDTPPDGPATPAEQVSLDYLQILLAKLQALGLNYTPVVESNNWNIEVPADKDSPPNGPDFDLRHTDRIATLIRTDQNSDLKVLRTNSAHFKSTSNCKLPTATGQQIEIVRGWTSVDLSIRGKAVRFINTHLDGDCIGPPRPNYTFQLAQADEILQGPVKEARDQGLPVILLGDLNSVAAGTGTPTYANLLKPKVGFVDAWTQGGSGDGLTCCQDDNLLNTTSNLEDRRDYVLFSRGPFQVIGAQVVGVDPNKRTPSDGFWPSDHAGVVAELRLPPE